MTTALPTLSGSPPVLITLVTGLLLAVAFQVLLTSFAAAVGVSALGFLPSERTSQSDSGRSTQGVSPVWISTVLGLGTLLTVNTALFPACFLAVRLSLVQDWVVGAGLGLVVWAGYCLIATWVGSKATGSLVGIALRVLGRGFRQLKKAIGAIVTPATPSPTAQSPTAEDRLIAQLEELTKSLTVLTTVAPPPTPDPPPLAKPSQTEPQKADLTSQLRRSLVQQLEPSNWDGKQVWQTLQTLAGAVQLPFSMADLTGNPIQADAKEFLLNTAVDQLLDGQVEQAFKQLIYDPEADPLAVKHCLQGLNRGYFRDLLRQRQDLSTDQRKQLVDRLETVRQEVLALLPEDAAISVISDFRTQVKAYVQTAKKSELKPTRFQKYVQRQLSDYAPGQWQDYLQTLNLTELQAWLEQRQDLSASDRKKLLTRLPHLCEELLKQATQLEAQSQTAAKALWQQLGEFVVTSEEKLTAHQIQRQLKALIRQTGLKPQQLRAYLPEFDQTAVSGWLGQRSDLSQKQMQRVADRLQTVWGELLPDSAGDRPQHRPEQGLRAIAGYLGAIDGTMLNPTTFVPALLGHLQAQGTTPTLLSQLSETNWQTLTEALEQRLDLTLEQRQQLLDLTYQTIHRFAKLPRRLAQRSQQVAQNLQTTVTDYFHPVDVPGLGSVPSLPDLSSVKAALNHQIDSLQQEAHQRLQTLQQQAQQQVQTTQKTVAIAAWWIFGTALTAGVNCAIAGALATGHLPLF